MSHHVALPRRLCLAVVATVLLLAGAAPAQAAHERLPVDLERATVLELQAAMERGRLTSEELTRQSINRIAALNTRGPALNAVRILNPDAIQEAERADRLRRTSRVAGPLHGIPVLLKDNIDVKGMPTTAGNVALEHSIPDRDAPIVTRLRRAGAVILGKTNLSEFANFMGNQPSGYSSLGGQVLSAYDANQGPSGSSSGAGAAAASGMAPLTIGTETSGSIISPAAQQGIVGIRPTLGLVSRTGILPLAASQDTAGPMTKTVADAALELQAIAGKDPADPATAGQPDLPNYSNSLKINGLQGMRLGVVTSNDAAYQAAVAKVEELGATTVQVPTPASSNAAQIITREFERDINAYLAKLPASAPMKSLSDIIAYNEANADDALKYGQGNLLAAEAVDLADPTQLAAYVADRDRGRAESRQNLDAILKQHDLDAFLTPSGTLTAIGARAGYPAITVPAGYTATQRRPVGITFTGTAYSEPTLIELAYGYEQATKHRQPPSVINPAMYRCADTTPPSVFGAHSCAPGRELLAMIDGKPPKLPFSLEMTSIDDLQSRMAARTLTAETLTEAYLARIAYTNTEGPALNAVRIINSDALDDAERLDRERRRGLVRGPLHGIPVLLKDNIDVAGLPTTAGALALEHSYPRGDSPVAANLRRAGAIILGKTNLSEFANFYSNNSVSGYSGLGGQVLTPIDRNVNPSGSSSGSGSAASAGLAAATVGSETSGSIISPASTHGIVGLRPTVGLVPRTGIIPISATQDTAGPMTQTVYDAAAELGGMAGKNVEDAATETQPAGLSYDYVSKLSTDALRGKRIGVIANTDATYQAAVAKAQELGATTVQITAPANTSAPSILSYEFKRDLNAYFARLPENAPMKSLADVIAFNRANAQEAIRLGMGLLESSEAIDLEAAKATYETSRATGLAQARGNIDAALTRGTADTSDDLTAILTPAGTLTGVGARAGYPALTVPAGYNPANRNPVNVTFTGTKYTEADLLAIGYAFEQATKARRAPSETNPATWRCVPGSATEPRSCPPSDGSTVKGWKPDRGR